MFLKFLGILCLLTCVAALALWDLTSTRIRILNASTETILGASIKIGEFETGCDQFCVKYDTGPLAPGEQFTLYWPTIHEGTVAVEYTIDGNRFSTPSWGYVTSGAGQWITFELKQEKSLKAKASMCRWWLDWIFDEVCRPHTIDGVAKPIP